MAGQWLDAGFQGGELLSYLQAEQVQVVLCLAGNKVLKRHAAPLAEAVRQDYAPYCEALQRYAQELAAYGEALQTAQEAGGKPPAAPRTPLRPGPRYGQVLYGAKAWGQRWRVLIKADMALQQGREPKLNVRYVLTDSRGRRSASTSASTASGGTPRTA